MPSLKSVSVSFIALFLSACTTANFSSPDYITADGQLYGEYLAGTYANEIVDAQARTDYYTKAFNRLPGDSSLGRRAITAALQSGDYKQAQSQAASVIKVNPNESLARTLLGVTAFSKGNNREAEKNLGESTNDPAMRMVMELVQGWSYAEQKDYEAAKALFEKLESWAYFTYLGKLQLGKLAAMQGDTETALALFTEVQAVGVGQVETVMSRARALTHAGRQDEALKELKDLSGLNGGFETGPIAWAISELEAGRDLGPLLTAKQQAARALLEPAFGFYLRQEADDVAEIYLRLATLIDPENDKGKLWLGSLMGQVGRVAEAKALYREIDSDSVYYVQAELSLATLYLQEDDDDKALAILEKSYSREPLNATRETLGRVRIFRENYEAALPIYDALVKSLSDEALKVDVEPLYFRGISYERLKQWDNAVADFRRVLELDPDNANALNYLGYTWVDRGENLTEAFEMIRKAVDLEPESGAIIDSLGWAHYKLGEYEQAKTHLEKAVVLSPASATIVDHLGDAYWKLGRFREAGYQWQRALDFDPTEDEEVMIKRKLEGGLEAANLAP